MDEQRKGLSITLIFKAQSLNYGEGIGNISELKKFSGGNGRTYTFASRQALRYDIVRLGNNMFNWKLEVVDKSKGTIQFKDGITIEDSQEMDLFGYMKTARKSENSDGFSTTRTAPVRISNAISLEEYKSDIEFLNNKGFADRIKEFPNLANVEQHFSYYTYTITIDLEKIGVDGNIELENNIKLKRVKELLEIIKILNRNIRGRVENLSPVFVIGGIYKLNIPFFLGRIKIIGENGKFNLDTDILKDTICLKLENESIEEDTNVGIIKGIFENEKEIEERFKTMSIQEFFESLENEVDTYYLKKQVLQ